MQKNNTGIFLVGLLLAGAAAIAQLAFGQDEERKSADELSGRGHRASF
jgi:hypothetical protein